MPALVADLRRSTPRPATTAEARTSARPENRADALALISKHFRGKKRTSVEKVFLAVYDLCRDAYTRRGDLRVPAERKWLSQKAGVHHETLDSAVRDLERLGLIKRQRRRVTYDRNLANLWSLAGVVSLAEIADTSTGTSSPTSTLEVNTLKRMPAQRRLRGGAAVKPRAQEPEFRWPGGSSEHPALRGLPVHDRRCVSEIYEIARRRLQQVGIRAPEGGWLSSIRATYELSDGTVDADEVEEALESFLTWREEGGGLSYSFAWMHKYRRAKSPPPSILFGAFHGDDCDRSEGETPFGFWLNYTP